MKTNSHQPLVAVAPPVSRDEGDTAAHVADVLERVKVQAAQIDVARNWKLVQTYLTLGLGVFATGMKSDAPLRFHAWQAFISALLFLSGHGLLTLLGGVFQDVLRTLWDIAALASWSFLVWRAAQGRPFNVPVIAAIAHRQAATASEDR
jgi:uncharacterized membrane protein